MDKERLLNFKKRKKSKNPVFIRQDTHKKKRLEKTWRRPRGRDSKLRLSKQNRALVNPGYGTPAELRGMNKSGLLVVTVFSEKDASLLDPKKHTALISANLGLRKKLDILNELIKKKVPVHNIKNPEEYIQKAKEKMDLRKKSKTEKVKEDKKEIVKESESIEDKLSEEEKKKLEKKEIDKLLTKKV